jgi:hypothetical protein
MYEPNVKADFCCLQCDKEPDAERPLLRLEHHREVSTTYVEFAVRSVSASRYVDERLQIVVTPYTANSTDTSAGDLWYLVCPTHGRLHGINVTPRND